ncbi:Mycobacterium numidiamassiliense ORFan, partial [Mycobacterium numidiamassiliense]
VDGLGGDGSPSADVVWGCHGQGTLSPLNQCACWLVTLRLHEAQTPRQFASVSTPPAASPAASGMMWSHTVDVPVQPSKCNWHNGSRLRILARRALCPVCAARLVPHRGWARRWAGQWLPPSRTSSGHPISPHALAARMRQPNLRNAEPMASYSARSASVSSAMGHNPNSRSARSNAAVNCASVRRRAPCGITHFTAGLRCFFATVVVLSVAQMAGPDDPKSHIRCPAYCLEAPGWLWKPLRKHSQPGAASGPRSYPGQEPGRQSVTNPARRQ